MALCSHFCRYSMLNGEMDRICLHKSLGVDCSHTSIACACYCLSIDWVLTISACKNSRDVCIRCFGNRLNIAGFVHRELSTKERSVRRVTDRYEDAVGSDFLAFARYRIAQNCSCYSLTILLVCLSKNIDDLAIQAPSDL